MEPFIIIIGPGLVGGVIVALVIALRERRSTSFSEAVSRHLDPLTPNAINMSRIQVAGAGGLGMVAMAVAVAIFVPRIRLTMAIALALGAVLAVLLIVLRRRVDPLPSSNHPGAHAMFPFDGDPDPSAGSQRRPAGRSSQELAAVPGGS